MVADKEPTSKSVAGVFSDKYITFYRLLLDLVNDVFEPLYFFRKELNIINKRPDVNQGLGQVDEFIVCLQLVPNDLYVVIRSKDTVKEAERAL